MQISEMHGAGRVKLQTFMKSIIQFTVSENAKVNTAKEKISHSLFKIRLEA